MTILRTLLIIVLALLPTIAWAQALTRAYVLQNAAAANTSGQVAHASGFSLVNVQVVIPTGASPTFTVTFEQSLNDTHYTATFCTPLTGGAPVTTSTATGHWRCNVSGSLWFRTRISGYTGPGAITTYAVLFAGGNHSAALWHPWQVAQTR